MPLWSYAYGGQLMPKSEIFFVTADLQQVLDNLPANEPRSRLDPFARFIMRWRREGRSYRRILQILANQCKVSVTYETLRRFVKRRSRPRKIEPELEADLAMDTTLGIPEQPARKSTKLSPEEAAAQRALIKALRNKPAVVSTEDRPVFIYDPDKPLTNKQT
jgi:hypothetical protein